MRCLICRNGIMSKNVGTYFAQLQGCYVIIENVPCWKCDQCGEIVYSASVLEKIEEILEKVEKVASKIFIMDYARAA
ncbi:MAG: type II toxin-antitoxin system MqsA family antitoxin [Anaerovibrio sp.]